MKLLIYILTFVLLMVNNHFAQNQVADIITMDNQTSCEILECCSSESKTEDESRSCCTDSFCMIGYSNVFVINQSYSPELPTVKFDLSSTESKFLYQNQYSFHLSFDFWNPPRV